MNFHHSISSGPYELYVMTRMSHIFACLLIIIMIIWVFESIEVGSTIDSKYMKCNSVSVLVFNVSAAVQFIN